MAWNRRVIWVGNIRQLKRSFKSARYNVFLDTLQMFLNIIGSGTGNRFSPQTHDDERDKEGTHSKTLNLLKLEILNNFTDAKCLLNY